MSSLASESINFGDKVSSPRPQNAIISKITIHHMAGNCKPENSANMHLSQGKASAHYYIGTDGKIVSGVSENRRAWHQVIRIMIM